MHEPRMPNQGTVIETRNTGPLSSKGEGISSGLFLVEFFLCGGLFRAVELEDGSYPNRSGLYAFVIAVLNRAFDLDVRALLELGCELAELAEDDEVVPVGARLFVFAGLFVLAGSLGRKRERGELLVVLAGANDCIATEEAHQKCFVQIHFVSPILNSRSCLGHTGRSQASGPASQVPSSAFTEGPSQMETVTRRAAKRKQKSAAPPGGG